jgi:hypothetical protein
MGIMRPKLAGRMRYPARATMHLVQLLLPVVQKQKDYEGVMHELTVRFGGVTAYSRAPAAGLWKNAADATERDDIIVVEVMVKDLDRAWWAQYRSELEQRLRQKEIVVRAQPMEPL